MLEKKIGEKMKLQLQTKVQEAQLQKMQETCDGHSAAAWTCVNDPVDLAFSKPLAPPWKNRTPQLGHFVRSQSHFKTFTEIILKQQKGQG